MNPPKNIWFDEFFFLIFNLFRSFFLSRLLNLSITSVFQWITFDWNGFFITSQNLCTAYPTKAAIIDHEKKKDREEEADAFENWIIPSKMISLLQANSSNLILHSKQLDLLFTFAFLRIMGNPSGIFSSVGQQITICLNEKKSQTTTLTNVWAPSLWSNDASNDNNYYLDIVIAWINFQFRQFSLAVPIHSLTFFAFLIPGFT